VIVPRKPANQTVSREEILQAAALVFQQRGYHGTTMADIAERVGLTAGSLYHHFDGGKPNLLAAVLNEGLDIVLNKIDAIMHEPLSPDQMLYRMIEAHIISVTENVAAGAAMIFESRTILEIPDAREAFIRRRDSFERYRQVIEHGIACGAFRMVDVPVFTRGMLGAHNWIGIWFRPEGRLSGEQIAAQMAETWLAALSPNAVSALPQTNRFSP
jgi:TetR/AcrR family transcriptional regulator, cholesterol catabolism regulator